MINVKEVSKVTAENYNTFLEDAREELKMYIMNCAARGVNFLFLKGNENIELSKAVDYLYKELCEDGFDIEEYPNKGIAGLSDWWIQWPVEEKEEFRLDTEGHFDELENLCGEETVW